MGISIADNFNIQMKKPLDNRTQYATLSAMKSVVDSTMSEGCFAYCVETDKYYKFLSSNSVDATLGKWREYSSGGGDDENAYHTTDTAETALADADYFPFYDTSATAKRKTLWSNIKSVLKTYFDTLYSTTKTRGTATSGGTTLSLVNTGDMYNWNTDSVIYCTSSTSASTAAKVAIVSRGTFTLVAGAKVCVKFTYSNTASAPTLNVASTGAKNIKYIGTDGVVETPNVWWGAGDIVTFIYDGTQFLMQLTYAMPSMPTLGSINRSDIYSTTEKVIGCWTDGRPIYQKVIEYTTALVADSANYIPHGISNYKQTIGLQILYLSGSVWSTIPNGITNATGLITGRWSTMIGNVYGSGTGASANSIEVWVGAGFTGSSQISKTIIIIQYTKTTDAANSYNYANENDYSTSEKIIGTWIDGKKIFQKTISVTIPTCTEDGQPVVTDYSLGVAVDTVVDVKSIANINGAFCQTGKVFGNVFKNPDTTYAGLIGQLIITVYNNRHATKPNKLTLSNSRTGYSGYSYYITIQYTKV